MYIRKANIHDTEGLARVHVESWKTTYKGIVTDKFLNSLSVESRNNRWDEVINNESHFIYVAENEQGEIVVGFCSGGPERSKNATYKGEVYAIYILASEQRKGLGKALLEPLVEQLKALKLDSLLVWVLEDNNSRHFYEKLGGKIVDQSVLEIAGKGYNELAYGWDDVKTLQKYLERP